MLNDGKNNFIYDHLQERINIKQYIFKPSNVFQICFDIKNNIMSWRNNRAIASSQSIPIVIKHKFSL